MELAFFFPFLLGYADEAGGGMERESFKYSNGDQKFFLRNLYSKTEIIQKKITSRQ